MNEVRGSAIWQGFAGGDDMTTRRALGTRVAVALQQHSVLVIFAFDMRCSALSIGLEDMVWLYCYLPGFAWARMVELEVGFGGSTRVEVHG
jgi:hypothetical protein